MIKHLNVTEDHLKLFGFISVSEDDDFVKIDKSAPFVMKNSAVEDIALVLGLQDKAISGTEDDAEGRSYPQEIEDYILSLYNDIKCNMLLWESLIHFYISRGGLSVGEYRCSDCDFIWEKVN